MPKSKSSRISQTQIAKELGFSQALVSMALNGRKKGISEDTYKTIWEYALQHGYSPRGMNIDTAKANSAVTTIGYLLRAPLKLATKSNFFSHIHQGLYDRLNDSDIKTVFLGSEGDISDAPLRLPESIRGIAVMGEVQPEFFEKIHALKRPIVYISARASGKCHSILSNEAESAELLVDHLYKLGHRQFAWLGGNYGMGRFSDRFEGLKQALAKRDIAIEDRHCLKSEGADRNEGFDFARALIEQAGDSKLPTAWVCVNGLTARGAINCLFQNGRKVGPEVSVAAFDMTSVCQEEHPTITCAGAPPEEMGAEAGNILIRSLSGETKALADATIPSAFVDGESTSEPA